MYIICISILSICFREAGVNDFTARKYRELAGADSGLWSTVYRGYGRSQAR